MQVVYDHFYSDVGALYVVVLLSDWVVDSIDLLFGCAQFPFSLCECVWQKGYKKVCTIVFLWEFCSACIVRGICIDNVFLSGFG